MSENNWGPNRDRLSGWLSHNSFQMHFFQSTRPDRSWDQPVCHTAMNGEGIAGCIHIIQGQPEQMCDCSPQRGLLLKQNPSQTSLWDVGQFLQFAPVIKPKQVKKLPNIHLRSFEKGPRRGTRTARSDPKQFLLMIRFDTRQKPDDFPDFQLNSK